MKWGLWAVLLTGWLAVWTVHTHHGKVRRRAPEGGARPDRGQDRSPEADSHHVPPGGNKMASHDALTEQRYYLLRLFGHYGKDGKLSFEGLRKLLTNLGLGELQVLQIEHDGLGHNHVSHLEALDLQENGHVHSHTTTDHITMLRKTGEVTSPRPHQPHLPKTWPTAASILRPLKQTRGKSRSPSISGRRNVPGDPKAGGRGRERLQRRSASERHGESPKGLHQVVKLRSNGADDKLLNHSKYNHLHENCLNVTQLLVNFGMGNMDEITPKQFTYICPALLYQIESRVCIQHHDWLDIEQDTVSKAVWACGFVAITLISLTSLMAVAIIPLLSHSFSKILLTFLVALAIGTLSADALLHLLPHSQSDPDHRHKTAENAAMKDSIWKGLSALGGIYLLLLIESTLVLFRNHSGRRPTDRHQQHLYSERGTACAQVDNTENLELCHLRPERGSGADTHSEEGWQVTVHSPELDRVEASMASQAPCNPPATDEGGKRGGSGSGKRHSEQESYSRSHSHAHSHAVGDIKNAGIADIAWMVIMGDGVHNFTDGLAIGAAFSTGISGGLSTSVAVFCHEIPHELGDFAMLLQAGMRVKQAVIFNLVSTLISYLGMAVGISIGQYTLSMTSWIFAGTSGMFLYVALVDMLPEMLHRQSDIRKGYLGHYIAENLGFVLGVGSMLCIALFEHQIKIHISL